MKEQRLIVLYRKGGGRQQDRRRTEGKRKAAVHSDNTAEMRMEELAKSDDFVQESIPDFLIQRGEESFNSREQDGIPENIRKTDGEESPKAFRCFFGFRTAADFCEENAGRERKKKIPAPAERKLMQEFRISEMRFHRIRCRRSRNTSIRRFRF